ncbi:hypothetical protein B9Z55_008218 [Caenorhabditis nigoni]|uniref:Uncharacterized protein n=1 Tax=Caenorhabditis nigoni TaxID=1611254 RepID=A0A2G5VD59_9PELO|nr:hypothetical protein B9Z55_008218 [Caenorhabditis nigoni]
MGFRKGVQETGSWSIILLPTVRLHRLLGNHYDLLDSEAVRSTSFPSRRKPTKAKGIVLFHPKAHEPPLLRG